MAIIHTKKRENPYVQIDKRCLEDTRLSWRAKGILAYLLSKPDDWQVSIQDLQNKAKEGREAVQATLKELRENGYAHLEIIKGEKGSFGGKKWVICEEPTNGFSVHPPAPTDKRLFRRSGSPTIGDSAASNNEVISNNKKSSESEKQKPTPAEVLEDYLQPPPSNLKNAGAEKIGAGPDLELYPNGRDFDKPEREITLSISDSPKADTAQELQAALRKFYDERPTYWTDQILEFSEGKRYSEKQRGEIVKDFCVHRISLNRGRDSYRMQHAELQKWFRNEKYAAWKTAKPNNNSVYEKPKGTVLI